MKQPIVECIPNFSEGRRVEVVEEIENAIRSVRGVYILDRHRLRSQPLCDNVRWFPFRSG